MKPFDAHCHLYDKKFDADRDEVIEKAKKVLSGIVVVGEKPESNRQILKLKEDYGKFWLMGFGIHPEFAHEFSNSEIEAELKWIKKNKPDCIGEVGLDYMWIKQVLPKQIGIKKADAAWSKQQKVFETFIQFADELGLPLNIHSRWATSQVVEFLEKLRPEKAILHAFSGNLAEAKRASKLGYKISIGNTVAYSEQKRDLAKHLPLSDLLIETDSPVLAPVKGERNEPSNLTLVVKEIAKIKNVKEAKVIEETNKNFKELFS